MLKHIDNLQLFQKIDWSRLSEMELMKIEAEFNRVLSDIEIELNACQVPSIIKEIISRNEEQDFLPVHLGFLVYQRLVQLEENKVLALQSFSDYLLLYGPDWQDEADQMAVALNNNDLERAVHIALKVDYDKYQ
ncbi:hypothetical protein [Tumebacillus sp. BK434]|uniref:hypothetical protein n=1 Tax=Tumebacillus sp. BK434 TaxID=2512169 RepID=UPI0010528C25|nr:hypothetical protein [Tumebacillus sp. BK434]